VGLSALGAFLRDRPSSTVRNYALAIGAIVFVSLSVSLSGPLGKLPDLLRVILGAVGLALLVRVVEFVLLRLRAAPMIGQWVYHSTSGNWGLATMRLSGDSLTYEVGLYFTEADLRLAVAGSTAKLAGSARGEFGVYEDGEFRVHYNIRYSSPDYPARQGSLVVKTVAGGADQLHGYWFSDLIEIKDGKATNTGELEYERVGTFLARGVDAPR
jgi:hypothetical protein